MQAAVQGGGERWAGGQAERQVDRQAERDAGSKAGRRTGWQAEMDGLTERHGWADTTCTALLKCCWVAARHLTAGMPGRRWCKVDECQCWQLWYRGLDVERLIRYSSGVLQFLFAQTSLLSLAALTGCTDVGPLS